VLAEAVHALPDVRDGVAKLTQRVDHIMQSMSELPQSKQCAADIAELRENQSKLNQFREYLLVRIAWITGAFSVVLYGILHAFQWLLAHINFTIGDK
jgi:hypothetical protein